MYPPKIEGMWPGMVWVGGNVYLLPLPFLVNQAEYLDKGFLSFNELYAIFLLFFVGV